MTAAVTDDWRRQFGIEPNSPALFIASKAQLDRGGDTREDDITIALCRALLRNRTARELMFLIETQAVELETGEDNETARLDIVFRPLIPREEIYFCLESKRMNVVKFGATRSYAAEYVTLGMMRFITRRYARAVRHGGMLAYVLDGQVAHAIANVEASIAREHTALCMPPPGTLHVSTLLRGSDRVRETHHNRPGETRAFCIHHLFVAVTAPAGAGVPRQPRRVRANNG